MKKYLFLVLMLVPMLGFVSCSDDDGDDLPQVEFNFETEGTVSVDGLLYVVQGETFKITAINVTNKEANKAAGIVSAAYYWDGYYLGTTALPPFAFEFVTSEDTSIGTHQIQVECPVYAVDKELANAVVTLNVEVVASADDIPTSPSQGGSSTFTPTITKAK
ncbi:MAG: hypothetical protein K2F63_03055 [Muribaculaceae bacterium]|nr:hypothetical protein [Muribaculaceae bacterium]